MQKQGKKEDSSYNDWQEEVSNDNDDNQHGDFAVVLVSSNVTEVGPGVLCMIGTPTELYEFFFNDNACS